MQHRARALAARLHLCIIGLDPLRVPVPPLPFLAPPALCARLDDAALSIKDKKNLRDAQGNVACSLQRKLLALKPVWNIVRNDVTIATVKKKLVSIRPTIVVHLQGEDGDRSADFSAKGAPSLSLPCFLLRRGSQGAARARARATRAHASLAAPLPPDPLTSLPCSTVASPSYFFPPPFR